MLKSTNNTRHCNPLLSHSGFLERVIQNNSWVGSRSNGDRSYAVKTVIPASAVSEISTCKDLYLEDIQTDEDKLNSSLLSSDSTFMPVASGLSPLSPTVAELRLHGIGIQTENVNEADIGFVKEVNKQDEEKQEKTFLMLGERHIEMSETAKTLKEVQDEGMLPVPRVSATTLSPSADISTCQTFSEDDVECSHLKQLCTCEKNLTVSSAKSPEEISADVPASSIQKKDGLEEMNRAAAKLQACWRGYYSRNHHPKAKEVRYEIRLRRMQEHIMHLNEEVKK